MAARGLYHVTAIAADAPRNVDFSARLLGLRPIEKTALPPRYEARRDAIEPRPTPRSNPRRPA